MTDIKPGRLSKEDYDKGFNCNMHRALDLKTAKIEALRCYFCYDAPCINACPTDIDIPMFIRKISTENVKGAAIDILSENIMGGTCARVCPVESLCEQACVRNTAEDKPVTIGNLQQFATDEYLSKNPQHPFERASSTGKKIAVVGAGPAGLSCAHGLAKRGHDVAVFEAKGKSGGLNEYGIAPYKMTDNFAQKEVEFILGVGGITVEHGKRLGDNLELSKLQKDFDAVFLAFGLGSTNTLNIPGEDLTYVYDAVDTIAQIRQNNPSEIPTGRDIVVIGGGSTAIDIAVQSKRLGAENVTLVYRRGLENMKATWKEQKFARDNGVVIKTQGTPVEILGESHVHAIKFEYTNNKGEFFELKADMIFKAIGQKLNLPENFSADLAKNKIAVDENLQTTVPGIFAGGDCTEGNDLTVVAVAQGKHAAQSIHKYLGGE